ncbi:unnamed protein product [Symbiodinium sp. CCMP2592]|nr:unnamed protein product [Symbiodinium sp. CCMP2592]
MWPSLTRMVGWRSPGMVAAGSAMRRQRPSWQHLAQKHREVWQTLCQNPVLLLRARQLRSLADGVVQRRRPPSKKEQELQPTALLCTWRGGGLRRRAKEVSRVTCSPDDFSEPGNSESGDESSGAGLSVRSVIFLVSMLCFGLGGIRVGGNGNFLMVRGIRGALQKGHV